MIKRFYIITVFLVVWFTAGARDFSVATKIDSLDRQIAAAREQLDVLDAEYYQNHVWGRGRYTSIGFTLLGNTDTQFRPKEYNSFGFFINQGTTYLFPRGKGFGSFIKLGFDARWVDLELVKYDAVKRELMFGADAQLPGNGITRYPRSLSMQRLSFLAGVCGIGPSVSIAPFSWSNNGMASIKINLYAHYQPAFGLCVYRGTPVDSEGERIKKLKRGPYVTEMGFVNIIDFGFRLQWSRFSAGVEYRRCFGRFPDATYRWKPAEAFLLNNDGRHYRRTFASTRIALAYSF